MELAKTFSLFVLTAVAEIGGCYLPYLWLRKDKSVWLLLPAALSLALFAWLLTLHPTGAGRTYAAYGGVYVAASLVWLWRVGRGPAAGSLGPPRRCGLPGRDRDHRSRTADPGYLTWARSPSDTVTVRSSPAAVRRPSSTSRPGSRSPIISRKRCGPSTA